MLRVGQLRRLSSAVQQSGPSALELARRAIRQPEPVLGAQDFLVSKMVAHHLRRPRWLAPAFDTPAGPAAASAVEAAAAAMSGPVSKTRLSSSPGARPPTFEADTLKVKIGKSGKPWISHWPSDDFQTMVGEMKTTIGRFVGISRENIRFRINLVPLSIDTKDCITSHARPNTPPASLIANYISDQIEGGKLRELGSKRGVSQLVKEIFEAYGPHTGRRRYVKGLRVLISGRLGQERAAAASAAEGTLPLSTLDADVDYATRRAETRSGIVGIKVWVVNDGVPLSEPETEAAALSEVETEGGALSGPPSPRVRRRPRQSAP
jgi:hypothetical protein